MAMPNATLLQLRHVGSKGSSRLTGRPARPGVGERGALREAQDQKDGVHDGIGGQRRPGHGPEGDTAGRDAGSGIVPPEDAQKQEARRHLDQARGSKVEYLPYQEPAPKHVEQVRPEGPQADADGHPRRLPLPAEGHAARDNGNGQAVEGEHDQEVSYV